jgi:DnaD/phage-associated family protein
MKAEANENTASVGIAAEFFTDQLPGIRDLAELKVVLHVWFLSARLGTPAVRLSDLMTSQIVRSVVGAESPEPAVERLRRAVERAAANGVILRLTIRSEENTEAFLLPATRRNRETVERATHDHAAAQSLPLPTEFEASLYRPNVFAVYEQYIGPLTPLVAEQLREAERTYPRAWVEQAIREAAHYKRRSWRYINAILAQWEERGAPPEAPPTSA